MALYQEAPNPLANPGQAQAGGRRQLIVFKQGEEEYGLTIDQIKEVVITPHITRMPQTPNYIRGVANVRGNIIAIVDLEEKFGLRPDPTTTGPTGNYTLVVESDELKLGILVREVPNTLAVLESEIEDASTLMYDGLAEGNYLKGVVKVKNRLIVLIDIFKVFKTGELGQMMKSA